MLAGDWRSRSRLGSQFEMQSVGTRFSIGDSFLVFSVLDKRSWLRKPAPKWSIISSGAWLNLNQSTPPFYLPFSSFSHWLGLGLISGHESKALVLPWINWQKPRSHFSLMISHIFRRQHLQSTSYHRLFIPHHWHSMFGRRPSRWLAWLPRTHYRTLCVIRCIRFTVSVMIWKLVFS